MEITELKASTKKKGRYLVRLDEGTLLRVGQQELLDFGLYQGKELTLAEAQALEESGQKSALKTQAYNAIARRPLSRRDLEQKLLSWEATEEEAQEICDRFQELALLNDEHFARALVRNQQEKGYGPQRIKQALFAHGIPRDLWDQALEELEEEDQQEAIYRFLSQKFRHLQGESPDQKQLKKVSDALARRGFSWDEIRSGLLAFTQDLEE